MVNAWFLYRRNTKWIDPQEKTMALVTFQANVASSLVSSEKRFRGRPSVESKLTVLQPKLASQSAVSTNIMHKIDGIDHMLN